MIDLKEILRLEHICYAYEEGRTALSDLSVTLSGGQKVAVLGSNGAGKSTFFLCCNGVLRPNAGRIFLSGREVGGSRSELIRLRQSVGLVFQDADSQLIAGTVAEEISFGPMNLGLSQEEVRRRVDTAVGDLQLQPLYDRAPHDLSGGEKKRVSIADVLAMEPQLLLFDEPASSLDPANTRLLEENLGKLARRELGLVIATHDVDFAWCWADRLLVFRDGGLAADGEPEAIFSDEDLLRSCGLQQPTLFQVGKKLRLSPLPRTVADIPG